MRQLLLAGAAWAVFILPVAAWDTDCLAPPAPEAPMAGLDEAIPLDITDRAHVGVGFGGALSQIPMVIDTGASIMSVSASLAGLLLRNGLAVENGRMLIRQADGMATSKERISVNALTVGGLVVRNVPAIINPDNVEMLLPFSFLANAGSFTIDVKHGFMVLGGGS
jgi:predicted aspartyl protease